MATKRLELAEHLSGMELKARMRACKEPKEARRWQALWLLGQGKSTAEAAEACGLSVRWVREVARRYNRRGVEALKDGHHQRPGGPRPLLNQEEQAELFSLLQEPVPSELGGGLWNGPKVALWIRKKTGKKSYPQQGWVYLQKLGFCLKIPRPRHPKAATEEEKKAFQKKSGASAPSPAARASRSRSRTLGRG